jgi:hypothetical protein
VAGMPWFLGAAGVALIVIGCIFAGLPGRGSRGGRTINPKMRDDDIIRQLKRDQRLPVSYFVILIGFVCILVSIGWRVLRAFL